MTAPFGEGTRYDASMKAIDAFLDYRKGDAFGLTFFGDAFVHWVPLTTDPSAIRCSPPFMRPEIAPSAFGGTAIAKALGGCKKELKRREDGDKMILLITDGFSYDLQDQDKELARDFKAERDQRLLHHRRRVRPAGGDRQHLPAHRRRGVPRRRPGRAAVDLQEDRRR